MTDMSQLLMPGPRNASLGEFPRPNLEAAGRTTTPVLKASSGVRWSFGNTAVAVMSGRTPDVADDEVESTPSPFPPVMSDVSDRGYVNPIGLAPSHEAAPCNCQSS